jgi:hypothetical protein
MNPWKQNPDPFFSSKSRFSEVVQAFPSENGINNMGLFLDNDYLNIDGYNIVVTRLCADSRRYWDTVIGIVTWHVRDF